MFSQGSLRPEEGKRRVSVGVICLQIEVTGHSGFEDGKEPQANKGGQPLEPGKKETDLPLKPPEGIQACQLHDFRLGECRLLNFRIIR